MSNKTDLLSERKAICESTNDMGERWLFLKDMIIALLWAYLRHKIRDEYILQS